MMCEKQWFLRTRIAWIHESIRIFGFINREHIMKKFGIASAQASHDLKLAMKWHPNLMQYDASRKCYIEQQPAQASGNKETGE